MIEDCTLCGLCKNACPIIKILPDEKSSPRAKAILIKEKKIDEIFNLCTLCEGCKVKCPNNVDLCSEIRKMRKRMILKGKESEANKKMIANVKKYGNPFGKVEKGKIPKDLYCC